MDSLDSSCAVRLVSIMAPRMPLSRLLAISGAVASLAGFLVVSAQNVDPRVQYQQRGNHYEGLRAEPISGSVRLLSARIVDDAATRANAADRSAVWPDNAVLRFFLPSAGDVSIVVRQIRPGSTYYVLDRVASAWSVGRDNEYTWPTDQVLRRLSDVSRKGVLWLPRGNLLVNPSTLLVWKHLQKFDPSGTRQEAVRDPSGLCAPIFVPPLC